LTFIYKYGSVPNVWHVLVEFRAEGVGWCVTQGFHCESEYWGVGSCFQVE